MSDSVSDALQGQVLIYRFPWILGALGLGWRHTRFLVLEHCVLLVYSTEEEWEDHHEAHRDITLSPESSVELGFEGEECVVRLRQQGRPVLVFGVGKDQEDSPTCEDWIQALTREIEKLRREEASAGRDPGQGTLRKRVSSWSLWRIVGAGVSTNSRERAISRGRSSARARVGSRAESGQHGGRALDAGTGAGSAVGARGREDEQGEDGAEGTAELRGRSSFSIGIEDIEARDGSDEAFAAGGSLATEEKEESPEFMDGSIEPAFAENNSSGTLAVSSMSTRGGALGPSRSSLGAGGLVARGESRDAAGVVVGGGAGAPEGGGRGLFRRWTLRRRPSGSRKWAAGRGGLEVADKVFSLKVSREHSDDDYESDDEEEDGDDEEEDGDDDDDGEEEERGAESRGTSGPVESQDHHSHGAIAGIWRLLASPFGANVFENCTCKWCKEKSVIRRRTSSKQPQGGLRKRLNVSYSRKCDTWGGEPRKHDEAVSPVVGRWEYLVGRWVPLQMARAGDIPGTRRFLDRYPKFPDKNNLLRAAVRYKQYALVEYFLDELNMDVNLENSLGMPLVWFSVVFMQRGDSGVMLRYLIQKGANIKSKNNVGQTVLFLVVSSRSKEAIPTLEFLVDEFGLSLNERDNFGSQPLHWAVLYGHLSTVQWISCRTNYGGTRADWLGAFQKMEKIRLIRPEHIGAERSWRIRGLQKSARSVSPLGVAVLHNHEEIAKYLMGYGTEEHDCIQTKRANLFNEENSDLRLVAKTWPDLLPGVFDGFVKQAMPGLKSTWENEESIIPKTGWLEHKYDIKLLYGIPQVPTSRSPLKILLSTGYPALFEIKVIQMIVALKWSVFGQRYYVWELGRYVVLTLSFILGFILWGHGTNWVGQAMSDDRYSSLEIIGGTVARVLCWVVTLFNLLVEEGREFRAAKSVRLYLQGGWNLQSIIAYVLVLSLVFVHRPWTRMVEWEDEAGEYTKIGLARRMMTAPASLLLYTRFTEHLAIWKSTGVFIAVIRMVLADTASWAVLFILLQVAFSLAFYSLLRGNDGYDNIWEALVSVFVMSMGEIDVPFCENGDLNTLAVILFVTFMLLVAIVYINLLVAMMTAGYDKVVNGATAQAMMDRASALVKWEGIMDYKTKTECYRMVAPEKGKRSHITLRGWFGKGSTEVFVDDEAIIGLAMDHGPSDVWGPETVVVLGVFRLNQRLNERDMSTVIYGATAAEPEESPLRKHMDPHALVMKELQELRSVVEGLSRRSLGHGGSSATSMSSSEGESSFRRRQAEMMNMQRSGLSGFRTAVKHFVRSSESVSAADIEAWRKKARKVEAEAKSKRGIIRAQALIRGHLQRSKRLSPQFLPATANM